MADDTVDIRMRLRGARQTSSDLKRVDKSLGGITKTTGSLTRSLGRLAAGGAAFYYLGRGVRFIASEYTEAAKAGAQTGAVIKSTGGAAGVTRAHVEGLANALSRKAAIDDEVIQSGENVLLTFKEIRNEAGRGNDVFDRGTTAALDLSVALGKDMRSSTIMVGKALNDPIKGITALGRAGVQFTAQQQEQITALVESGDKLSAQKIILRELESQVKGSAKAQAQPVERMQVGFANIAESIGMLAAPTVNRGIDHIADLLDELQPLFDRKDLTLGEKIERALPRVEAAFENAHVGDALASAVETGMPIVANAAARAAPRAASAFVNGFVHAGPWGRLVTVAFLASKMGAFSAVGPIAARKFAARFAPVAAAESVTAMTAAGGATSLVGASSTRKFRGAGKIGGRALGAGIAAGVILAGPEIVRGIEEALGITPGEGGLGQYSGGGGWAELGRDLLDYLPGEDSEDRRRNRIPPATPMGPRQRRQQRGSEHKRAGAARAGSIVVPVTVVADGRPIAKATARANRIEALSK